MGLRRLPQHTRIMINLADQPAADASLLDTPATPACKPTLDSRAEQKPDIRTSIGQAAAIAQAVGRSVARVRRMPDRCRRRGRPLGCRGRCAPRLFRSPTR